MVVESDMVAQKDGYHREGREQEAGQPVFPSFIN